MTGSVGYHAGDVAEDIVASDYICRNYQLAARRWRGKGGEIDLVMRDGDQVIFVEVKKSKTFAAAARRRRYRCRQSDRKRIYGRLSCPLHVATTCAMYHSEFKNEVAHDPENSLSDGPNRSD